MGAQLLKKAAPLALGRWGARGARAKRHSACPCRQAPQKEMQSQRVTSFDTSPPSSAPRMRSGVRWYRNFDYMSAAQPSAHVLSPTWLTPLPKSSSLS